MERVDRVLKLLVGLLLLAIAGIVVAQVFFRFVLSNALPWPEELGRLLFIYLVFIGGGLASLHRDHISIEILDVMVKSPKKMMVIAVIRELIIIAVMVAAIDGAIRVIPRAHRLALSATGLPKSLMSVPVVIGALLMGLESIRRCVLAFKGEGNKHE